MNKRIKIKKYVFDESAPATIIDIINSLLTDSNIQKGLIKNDEAEFLCLLKPKFSQTFEKIKKDFNKGEYDEQCTRICNLRSVVKRRKNAMKKNYEFNEVSFMQIKSSLASAIKAAPALSGWGLISQMDFLYISMTQLKFSKSYQEFSTEFEQDEFNSQVELVNRVNRAIKKYNKIATL